LYDTPPWIEIQGNRTSGNAKFFYKNNNIEEALGPVKFPEIPAGY
jgi:hypothetical protein